MRTNRERRLAPHAAQLLSSDDVENVDVLVATFSAESCTWLICLWNDFPWTTVVHRYIAVSVMFLQLISSPALTGQGVVSQFASDIVVLWSTIGPYCGQNRPEEQCWCFPQSCHKSLTPNSAPVVHCIKPSTNTLYHMFLFIIIITLFKPCINMGPFKNLCYNSEFHVCMKLWVVTKVWTDPFLCLV